MFLLQMAEDGGYKEKSPNSALLLKVLVTWGKAIRPNWGQQGKCFMPRLNFS